MSDDSTVPGEELANAPKWVKQLRKEAENAKKEAAELRKEVSEFRTQKRQGALGDILKAKGIDPAAAELYTGEDVSEDAVGKWVEKFGKAFGVAQAAPDPNAQAAQRVSDASYGHQPLPEIPQNASVQGDHAELEHLMRTLPREELQKRGMLPPDSGLFGPRGK